MCMWHFLLAAFVWRAFSHHLLTPFKWIVTQCILPTLSSPTYSFSCGCASFLLMSSQSQHWYKPQIFYLSLQIRGDIAQASLCPQLGHICPGVSDHCMSAHLQLAHCPKWTKINLLSWLQHAIHTAHDSQSWPAYGIYRIYYQLTYCQCIYRMLTFSITCHSTVLTRYTIYGMLLRVKYS